MITGPTPTFVSNIDSISVVFMLQIIIQELEDWLEEASHRDEDAMTLMKYAKIDDAKIKVFINHSNIVHRRLFNK